MESKLSKNIPDLAKGEVFSLKVVKKNHMEAIHEEGFPDA
jgi:hypothetical protein